MVVNACNPSYMGKYKQEDQSTGQHRHKTRLYLKIAKAKRTGRGAQDLLNNWFIFPT
jgi:hypothetical protein